jgi:ABC-type nitrate/sulfonate/bicarbonate transport system ATPase subunit
LDGYDEMRNTPDIVLSVKNISAGYGRKPPVLQAISFDVADGEIVAVLGPSGCGKSTLLLLLGGFLGITNGAIMHRGQPIIGPSADRILLTQFDSTWPWKKALENVAYPLRCLGHSGQAAMEKARRWIEAVGLGDFGDVYPDALSGGMRQRVGLAKVFALGPQVLLLDEPLAGLDEVTRQAVNEVFLQLWRQTRMTVLMVTHSINEALYLADRLVVFGGAPARVLGDFSVPSPRPGAIESTFSPEADALRVNVLRLLREHGTLPEKACATG